MTVSSTHDAILAVWRIESARLVGALARVVRDVGVAEELAQDAFVVALEQWPATGIPDKPGAWLMTTAKRRAFDRLRRGPMLARKHAALTHATDAEAPRLAYDPDDLDRFDREIDDNMLRLIFVACHPVLSTEARVALTLRLVGGLTVPEVARALLLNEATAAQRIVRAKRTLAERRVPFEVPRKEQWAERTGSVLEVIYLIFNEGYAATRGSDWMRPALCEDALRLARILAALLPAERAAHGLLALLELQASRTAARTDAHGNPVLLADQDRRRWNQLLIRRGLGALARAEAIGGAPCAYTLQAAIAACHATAPTPADTDWTRIKALYTELLAATPSVVIALNRAVAVAMADGPAAGLPLVDALTDEGALANYHLLWSVRADLLYKLGRSREARAAFVRAAACAQNERERSFLLERAAGCDPETLERRS